MFGRRRDRDRAPVTPRGTVAGGVRTEAVLVANPDVATIGRDAALRAFIGYSNQAPAGQVVDYDRGDPEHSYTRVVVPWQDPTGSIARIGMRDGVHLAQGEVYDIATTDEELTAYQAAMLARISR